MRCDRINRDSGYWALSCLQDKAHARRHFYEAHIAQDSQLAKEAIERIGGLYQIEGHIRGSSPDKRLAARQRYAVPLLKSLHTWMIESLAQIEKKSALAEAFRYSLNRWDALCRYTEDGRLEIDNSIAERSIRGIVVGRKGWLFSDTVKGAIASANLFSLVETAKANGLEPHAYLCHVFERLPHAKGLEDFEALLPWNANRPA